MSTRSSPPKAPSPPPRRHGHSKQPSTSHASMTTCRSNDSSSSRSVWDTEDTFLPRAKPPPPLPKLNKHRRTQSHHTPSSTDLPVLDISRRYLPDAVPTAPTPLSRSDTHVTASSGTSEESLPKHWRPPPSWAGPHACVEDPVEAPKPARSLSRLRSQRRAPSKTRTAPDVVVIKPKTPEPEVIRLVDIVGSGDPCDRGRCPSTGVKIQYYEGWHEKPIQDVVHMMRELRFK